MPVPIEDFPKIISVDDHVVEPPHVWQDRLVRPEFADELVELLLRNLSSGATPASRADR